MNNGLSKIASGVSPSPTLAIDAIYKKMKSDGFDVISFGVGEPDFYTPLHVKTATIEAVSDDMTRYTETAGTLKLREAISLKLKEDNGLEYSPSDIVVSNGAKHAIMNVLFALVDPGDEVLIPLPYWVSYPEMVKLVGGVPVFIETFEEENFKVTPSQLQKAITNKTKLLILNSPSNPTGVVYGKNELSELAKVLVENKIFVLSDEIYEKLIYDCEHVSIAELNSLIKNLTIVINGLSKSFAMTGFRIGYSASNSIIANAISNIQSHMTSCPNSIAQEASRAALIGCKEPVRSMVEEYKRRRDYMLKRIQNIESVGCTIPNGAFYFFVNIKNLLNRYYYSTLLKGSDEFAMFLLKKSGIAVVPGSSFGMEGYVRFSFSTDISVIRKGFDKIDEFLRSSLFEN